MLLPFTVSLTQKRLEKYGLAKYISLVIDHIYDLAKISHSPLPAEQMTKFIERSKKLLEKLF